MKNQKIAGLIIASIVVISVIAAVIYFYTSSSSTSESESEDEIRIVSLMPSLTQSMYYLGAQSKLVGCTNYCRDATADGIEIVSSVMKPNVEKIVSSKPDVVLVSGLISDKDIETIQKFGIRVEKFLSPTSFDEICAQFIRVGEIVGEEQKAAQIVEQSMKSIGEIGALKGDSTSKSKPKIFIQIGASPIHTVIPNTFMDDYITFCGGTNIAHELTRGSIGREFVVSKNPDIIFIVTMGIAGEEEADQWRQFKQMNAVVNNKIFILNSDTACQPTPITFIETLILMNKYISE